jgi:hypothetical protein
MTSSVASQTPQQDSPRSRAAPAIQWLSRDGRWACVVVLALQCIIAVATRLDYPIVRDERYHFPMAQTFGTGLPSLHLLRTYHDEQGPFLFWLLGNLTAAFHYAAWMQRLIILLMSMATVLLIRALACRLGSRYPGLPVLLIGFYPYFFGYSFLVLTDVPAVFFFVLSLYLFMGVQPLSWWRAVMASISLVCAVDIRICYVFACMGLLAAMIVIERKLTTKTILIALLPVILMTPLIWLWRGLRPPWHQQVHSAQLAPDSLNLSIATLGFYFWPVFIVLRRRLARWSVLSFPAILLLLYGFNPNTSKGWEFNAILGLLGSSAYFVYCAILWVIGGLVLLRTYSQLPRCTAMRQLAAMLVFAIGVVSLPFWLSKYAMGAYATLTLLTFGGRDIASERVWIAYAWCAVLCIVSVVLFFRFISGWEPTFGTWHAVQ